MKQLTLTRVFEQSQVTLMGYLMPSLELAGQHTANGLMLARARSKDGDVFWDGFIESFTDDSKVIMKVVSPC